MRILQISTDRSPRGILHRGSAAFKRQEAYAKKIGNVDIIGSSRISDCAKKIEAGELRIYPTNSRSPLWYGMDAIRIARTLLRPDIITVQDPFETGLVAWWIARLLKVPLHVQVHTDFLSPEYARHSLLNRMRVQIAAFVLRRAASVRVVSDRIKDSVQEKYHLVVPVIVLPIFVDISQFQNAAPLQEFPDRERNFTYKLLMVSRDAPEKNIPLAIHAFEQVAPADACLVIFGNVPMSVVQKKQDRIYCMTHPDIERYYKSADLILVPSRYEGYGLVIIEALAAGKPVLSTDVGVAREAGAIITDEEHFAAALADWFAHGPREGFLKDYPYRNFDEYVQKYCDDIVSAKMTKQKESL